MQWADDERGMTMEFVKLLASLGVGACIVYAIYATAPAMLDGAADSAPGGMGGMAMNGWFETFLVLIPLVFLLVSFFGFIARAVYERGSA